MDHEPALEETAEPATETRAAPTPRQSEASTVDTAQTESLSPHGRNGPTLPDPRSASAAQTPVPTNIYRARRPAVALFLILPAVAVGLLLVRALAISAFGRPFLIDGVIASSLALASLPMLVAGLYGLITGAAHGAEHWGFKVWARPPLAYLVVGIAFVVAAGLAIG